MMTTTELPEEAWVVALLSLPKLGPRRLSQLLELDKPSGVWRRICRGTPIVLEGVTSGVVEGWRSSARSMAVDDHWRAIGALGVQVASAAGGGYPRRLVDDIDPPALVFSLGETHHAIEPEAPTVGIVGTRAATSYGARVAFELGAALAASGVSVVSGLARGIDGAAHRGALSVEDPAAGKAVGVVGSGLDVIYPRQHADLWTAVAQRGLLLSETPPGVRPDTWRFPARNRIIAALSDAVVVVESHATGGSLITVDEAIRRDIAIGAVPGPITSNSAEGTNRLLVDGATPVTNVSDIHALIGFTPARLRPSPHVQEFDSFVLDVLGWTPLTLEQLCSRIDVPSSDVAAEIERLIEGGLCRQNGPWIERVA